MRAAVNCAIALKAPQNENARGQASSDRFTRHPGGWPQKFAIRCLTNSSHTKTWAVTRPRLIDYRPITQD